jgi:hypothetical protein
VPAPPPELPPPELPPPPEEPDDPELDEPDESAEPDAAEPEESLLLELVSVFLGLGVVGRVSCTFPPPPGVVSSGTV